MLSVFFCWNSILSSVTIYGRVWFGLAELWAIMAPSDWTGAFRGHTLMQQRIELFMTLIFASVSSSTSNRPLNIICQQNTAFVPCVDNWWNRAVWIAALNSTWVEFSPYVVQHNSNIWRANFQYLCKLYYLWLISINILISMYGHL